MGRWAGGQEACHKRPTDAAQSSHLVGDQLALGLIFIHGPLDRAPGQDEAPAGQTTLIQKLNINRTDRTCHTCSTGSGSIALSICHWNWPVAHAFPPPAWDPHLHSRNAAVDSRPSTLAMWWRLRRVRARSSGSHLHRKPEVGDWRLKKLGRLEARELLRGHLREFSRNSPQGLTSTRLSAWIRHKRDISPSFYREDHPPRRRRHHSMT